jgi:hypothetical protein
MPGLGLLLNLLLFVGSAATRVLQTSRPSLAFQALGTKRLRDYSRLLKYAEELALALGREVLQRQLVLMGHRQILQQTSYLLGAP